MSLVVAGRERVRSFLARPHAIAPITATGEESDGG